MNCPIHKIAMQQTEMVENKYHPGQMAHIKWRCPLCTSLWCASESDEIWQDKARQVVLKKTPMVGDRYIDVIEPVSPDPWISAENPPEESGRYWCYVEEQTETGISGYQWNCAFNKETAEWSGEGLRGEVRFWTHLLEKPRQL